MAREFLTAINLSKNELQNARIQNLAAAPGSPVEGQIYWDTVDETLYIYDGATWVDLAAGTGGGDADTLEGNDSAYHLARTNHTGTQAASTISDFDTQVRTNRLDQMAAPTASVAMGSQKITGLLDPTSDQDAATKAYVDAARAGLDVKASVRVATAGTLNANTRSGNVLTSDNVESINDTGIDGVTTLIVGDRVLVKNEVTGANNGIYTVTNLGSVGTSWTLTRAEDADASAEVTGGMFTFVSEGTLNADSGWVLTTNDAITLNTTALTFAQFSGAGQITAGSGLTKSGNTLTVGAGTGITVNADDVAVDTTVVARKYSTTVGNGALTDITVTHNLNTRAVVVEVYTNSGDYPTVICDVKRTGVNTVQLTFAVAPTTDQYAVIITG
jgi:hypothetical protein